MGNLAFPCVSFADTSQAREPSLGHLPSFRTGDQCGRRQERRRLRRLSPCGHHDAPCRRKDHLLRGQAARRPHRTEPAGQRPGLVSQGHRRPQRERRFGLPLERRREEGGPEGHRLRDGDEHRPAGRADPRGERRARPGMGRRSDYRQGAGCGLGPARCRGKPAHPRHGPLAGDDRGGLRAKVRGGPRPRRQRRLPAGRQASLRGAGRADEAPDRVAALVGRSHERPPRRGRPRPAHRPSLPRRGRHPHRADRAYRRPRGQHGGARQDLRSGRGRETEAAPERAGDHRRSLDAAADPLAREIRIR